QVGGDVRLDVARRVPVVLTDALGLDLPGSRRPAGADRPIPVVGAVETLVLGRDRTRPVGVALRLADRVGLDVVAYGGVVPGGDERRGPRRDVGVAAVVHAVGRVDLERAVDEADVAGADEPVRVLERGDVDLLAERGRRVVHRLGVARAHRPRVHRVIV